MTIFIFLSRHFSKIMLDIMLSILKNEFLRIQLRYCMTIDCKNDSVINLNCTQIIKNSLFQIGKYDVFKKENKSQYVNVVKCQYISVSLTSIKGTPLLKCPYDKIFGIPNFYIFVTSMESYLFRRFLYKIIRPPLIKHVPEVTSKTRS